MKNRPTIQVLDAVTGEEYEREMTDEELAFWPMPGPDTEGADA